TRQARQEQDNGCGKRNRRMAENLTHMFVDCPPLACRTAYLLSVSEVAKRLGVRLSFLPLLEENGSSNTIALENGRKDSRTPGRFATSNTGWGKGHFRLQSHGSGKRRSIEPLRMIGRFEIGEWTDAAQIHGEVGNRFPVSRVRWNGKIRGYLNGIIDAGAAA